jgi:glycosyltransferase involved in cell wall biosynthesis
MSDRPQVSIVIANFNYGRFVADAIRSALAQTYNRVEVIVVDDGSSDDSRAVIEGFAGRVLSIFKPNGGHGSAFNAGFSRSRGDVVLFLDSDDMLLPTAAEEAVRHFDDPGVVHVHWPLLKVDGAGNRTGEIVPSEPLPTGDIGDFVIANGPATWSVAPTSGNAWSRRLLEQIMPIPEAEFRQAAESYLFTLSPVYGHLAAVKEPQSLYRIHGTNYTLSPAAVQREEYLVRYGYRAEALRRHLRRARGVEADPAAWRRVAWLPRLDAALHDVQNTVPAGCSLVLADEDQWSVGGQIAGRPAVPLVERDGVYWGRPADDAQAVGELRRHLNNGSQYIVFGWPAFWWLEHYPALTQFLSSSARCLLRNDRVAIFAMPPLEAGA